MLRAIRTGGHISPHDNKYQPRNCAADIPLFYSFYKMLPISSTVRQTAAGKYSAAPASLLNPNPYVTAIKSMPACKAPSASYLLSPINTVRALVHCNFTIHSSNSCAFVFGAAASVPNTRSNDGLILLLFA